MEQSVLPHTISSDLHIYNVNGPVYDLISVISKFLHLGMSLDDAIAKVTSIPEYFERRFDRNVRLLATICVLGYLIGYVGVNLFTMGKVLNALLGWQIPVAAF